MSRPATNQIPLQSPIWSVGFSFILGTKQGHRRLRVRAESYNCLIRIAPVRMERALDNLVAPPRGNLGAAATLERLENGTNNQWENAMTMHNNQRAFQRDAANGQNILQPEKQTAAKEAKRNLENCTEKVRRFQAEIDTMDLERGELRATLDHDRTSEKKMSSGDRSRSERDLETLDSDLDNGTRRLLAARTLKKDLEKELKELNIAMSAATTEVVQILPLEGILEEFNDPTVRNDKGAVE